MTENKNVTIAILSVSAAILLTILATMHLTQPAYAGPTVRGGDYIVTTGAYSNRVEIVYVINTAQQKINAYVIDYNAGAANNQIILQDSINLKQAFAAK